MRGEKKGHQGLIFFVVLIVLFIAWQLVFNDSFILNGGSFPLLLDSWVYTAQVIVGLIIVGVVFKAKPKRVNPSAIVCGVICEYLLIYPIVMLVALGLSYTTSGGHVQLSHYFINYNDEYSVSDKYELFDNKYGRGSYVYFKDEDDKVVGAVAVASVKKELSGDYVNQLGYWGDLDDDVKHRDGGLTKYNLYEPNQYISIEVYPDDCSVVYIMDIPEDSTHFIDDVLGTNFKFGKACKRVSLLNYGMTMKSSYIGNRPLDGKPGETLGDFIKAVSEDYAKAELGTLANAFVEYAESDKLSKDSTDLNSLSEKSTTASVEPILKLGGSSASGNFVQMTIINETYDKKAYPKGKVIYYKNGSIVGEKTFMGDIIEPRGILVLAVGFDSSDFDRYEIVLEVVDQ